MSDIKLDRDTLLLQARAYGKGYQDSLAGIAHEDKGDFYNQGYSDAYWTQQQQTSHEVQL